MYPGTYAALTPDRSAVLMSDGWTDGPVLTYRQLDEGSARIARLLRQAGLRRGDAVVLLSENSPRVFEVYWAAQRSGLYFTAVDHHLSIDEISYIVKDSGAWALITSATLAGKASPVLDQVPAVTLRLAYGGRAPGFTDLDTAVGRLPAGPLRDQPRGADMLYSSGATGRPKGVRPPLPERAVDAPGDTFVGLFGPRYGFDRATVYLSPAPLYHAAPLRFCATVQSLGGTVVVLPRFDPEGALAAIERHRITHSQWVPTMFVRMLKLPPQVRARYDVSSLRVAIHSAAPCPVDVKRAMIDWWGPVLYEYYAATEANGITFIDPQQWLQRPGSVGRAGLGTLRICDDDGSVLAPGQVGTVYFERDELPFRYHNDPARTRQAQHPAHPTWTTVGDLGRVDQDGYLYLTDRKAFMIISAGVNIYPQEIEDRLTLHPAVADVAVIGVPDEELGEAVKAVVQPAPGILPGPELAAELIEFVQDRIARFKAPRSIDFVDELPRTATGKLLKGKLRSRYLPTSR